MGREAAWGVRQDVEGLCGASPGEVSQSKIVADEKPKLSPRGLPFYFSFRFVRPIGIERYGELSGSKFAPAGKVNFVVFASSSISRTFFARVPFRGYVYLSSLCRRNCGAPLPFRRRRRDARDGLTFPPLDDEFPLFLLCLPVSCSKQASGGLHKLFFTYDRSPSRATRATGV